MFKATRPNGTDFKTGRIHYDLVGGTVKHPHPLTAGDPDASGYISVATVATDCTSFNWPARLFEVEIVGEKWAPHAGSMPNKMAGHEIRILAELPAWQLFGPLGYQIVAIIDAFGAMDYDQRRARSAARPKGWSDAYSELWSVVADGRADRAGLGAARYALYDRLDGWRVGHAAYGAALAVLCKEFLTTETYDALVAPYLDVIAVATES
ncbi:MAG TPA: hypothetical protein VGI56_09930 [Galbitalea sp.]|jgi:hypothetical protein